MIAFKFTITFVLTSLSQAGSIFSCCAERWRQDPDYAYHEMRQLGNSNKKDNNPDAQQRFANESEYANKIGRSWNRLSPKSKVNAWLGR